MIVYSFSPSSNPYWQSGPSSEVEDLEKNWSHNLTEAQIARLAKGEIVKWGNKADPAEGERIDTEYYLLDIAFAGNDPEKAQAMIDAFRKAKH